MIDLRRECRLCGVAGGGHSYRCVSRPVMAERADPGAVHDPDFQTRFDAAIRRNWPGAVAGPANAEMAEIIGDVARQVDEITGVGAALDQASGQAQQKPVCSDICPACGMECGYSKENPGCSVTGLVWFGIPGTEVDVNPKPYPRPARVEDKAKVWRELDDSSSGGGKLKGDSYYRVSVAEPMDPGVEPYVAECADIIEALGMTFNEGEAFKAVWRLAAARSGKVKPGAAGPQYDADKVAHYGARVAAQAAQEAKKGQKP